LKGAQLINGTHLFFLETAYCLVLSRDILGVRADSFLDVKQLPKKSMYDHSILQNLPCQNCALVRQRQTGTYSFSAHLLEALCLNLLLFELLDFAGYAAPLRVVKCCSFCSTILRCLRLIIFS